MIVTLAGHVDHGKTSLVKALSGIDTDRLSEEKRRGLTIDLGFAYMQTGETGIGFVDVPGHHKFIHNMVAGVAHTQFAMLVIAADDGPMPQTQEHLDILGLMGLQRGMVVISKTDKVSGQALATCLENTRGLLRDSFLENCCIKPVSTLSGAGVPEVLQFLIDQAKTSQIAEDTHCFRMAIDRAFTIKGSGLVVTGTVHSGQVDMNTTVSVSSTGKQVRIRGIFKQNQPTTAAQAGDRCSLNISGIDRAQVSRGDWILDTETYAPSNNLVIQLKVLPEFPRVVKHWLPVHIFHATSHTTGKIALLDSAPIQPGGEAMVELELDSALFPKRKDRVVIREYGAERTLGGGEVIDITPSPYRRRDKRRLAHLKLLSSPTPEDALNRMLHPDQDDKGILSLVNIPDFRQNWNLKQQQMDGLLNEMNARVLPDSHGSYAYRSERDTEIATTILDVLKKHHSDNPASAGIKPDSLRNLIAVPDILTNSVMARLENAELITVTAGLVQLPTQAKVLPAKVQAMFDAYAKIAQSSDQPPSLGDAAKLLNVVQAELAKTLKIAARAGLLTEVSTNRFFLPEQLKKMIKHVMELTENDASFSVRDYRDKSGIGRNTAIEVLEHFDARGFTKRFANLRKRISTYK